MYIVDIVHPVTTRQLSGYHTTCITITNNAPTISHDPVRRSYGRIYVFFCRYHSSRTTRQFSSYHTTCINVTNNANNTSSSFPAEMLHDFILFYFVSYWRVVCAFWFHSPFWLDQRSVILSRTCIDNSNPIHFLSAGGFHIIRSR